MAKRALISVSDKTGLTEFAKGLAKLGWEIISTGGTHKAIEEAGIPVTGVSQVTGFPECLNGRVKTLHPAVHGGILAMRDNPEHMRQIKELEIETIDIVAINLYPFKQTIMKPDTTLPDAIENIDIGGPTMLRSAAKNHKDVAVICDPADYDMILGELGAGADVNESGAGAGTGASANAGTPAEISYETKYKLALKVFEHTAAYDAMIAEYLRAEKGIDLPDNPTFTDEKIQNLRYGENPQQWAAYYREVKPHSGALVNARQLNGKELSFNNINDTNGALAALREFDEPSVIAVKHANPCGAGSADSILAAYRKAYAADPVSIFGGIIAANREIDEATARELIEVNKVFAEIIIAPGYTNSALNILKQKENLRVLELLGIENSPPAGELDMKKIDGGILIQGADRALYDKTQMKTVTEKQPTAEELNDMEFAMKIVKHVKSNAIVIARDGMTLGVGPGQTNRVSSVEIAIKGMEAHANEAVSATLAEPPQTPPATPPNNSGSIILASDAFFPFDDCVTVAAAAGVKAIIQPGGSVRDEDSIKRADQLGIAMVFTGDRHFKH
jgi:phosphoribosylaminoimidazolecarboxamide formyltransferase/IMP cyclohydrolase